MIEFPKVVVWVAQVTTDSGDDYLFVYDHEPSMDGAIRQVWETEKAASLKFYRESCAVRIEKCEVKRNG